MHNTLKRKALCFTLLLALAFSITTTMLFTPSAQCVLQTDSNNIQINDVACYNNEEYPILPQFTSDATTASVGKKFVNIGGFPIGINLKTDGLIILSKCRVVTSNGVVEPAESIDIKNGDVLLAVDDTKIKCKEDIEKALENCSDSVTLTIRRGSNVNNYQITPVVDSVNGKKRLGLVLQDGVLGIGTMTFVDSASGKYACLGHPIKDCDNNDVRCGGGNIYTADVSGVKKGQKGKAGELSGMFDYTLLPIGDITKNNTFGIYGSYDQKITSSLIEVADKDSVKPGKAQILTTISGNKPRLYDIEIIKTNKQSQPADKSMVIRIIDEELLKITGGIVQGMSGSPIIQNNKLVGAVTHVFVNDPTKGYGLYAQWMLEECNK